MKQNEFTYGESVRLDQNKYVQAVVFDGKQVGFRISDYIGFQRYEIPDVEIEPEYGEGLLPGKIGWIEFKPFDNSESAMEYVRANFERVVYLMENCDFD